MLDTVEYRDYMLSPHPRSYPVAPYLAVAKEADILSMRSAKSAKAGMFMYELLLMSGCLIDDLCGDPVR